jgi:hypothetical protein
VTASDTQPCFSGFEGNNHQSVEIMVQLELDLASGQDNRIPTVACTYRFTRDALVEELPDTRVVYGLWDKLFGCWVINSRTTAFREVIPTWRPLNLNGVWRDQSEVRASGDQSFPSALSPRWRYEANAAFAGLFSGVPQRIRSVVGSLDYYQWLALDLIWQHPPFARFLDEEIFNDTQQFVFACFVLAKAEKLPRRRRRDLAERLMTCKRTDLLSEFSGVTCTRATLRAINKLGETPCEEHVYRAIIEIMANEEAAKALSHAGEIEPYAIEALNTLNRAFLLPNVIRVFLSEPDVALALRTMSGGPGFFGVEAVVELFPETPEPWRRRAIDSLARVGTIDEFIAWGDKWEERLVEIVRFPVPPIGPRQGLIPLSSPAAMRTAAREMQNCLAEMIPDVLSREVFFYHWNGPEPATVMLDQYPEEGWQFSEALGFDNEPLTDHTRNHIQSLIENPLRAGLTTDQGVSATNPPEKPRESIAAASLRRTLKRSSPDLSEDEIEEIIRLS